ncbi:FtsX-like permease family protein [Symbiobacterium thermophilum]|uniref:ABC transporter permease protein n=1 Tax=Symbiobacterium thermophilum (strain DSM 24528 / JCM 14929 / IAM 14863 / T) TaxID=292459 RepID=Q67JF7_SYMTH|nr:ABC transporter permease [Symbiobacterium thermophilum]BAD42193.1 ABC transporter permease protein [Symbiobacterium thermophilum IAM 14863]
MSLWQIAARNVWRNRGRYLAYLGSAAFAVMIYFIYTALALHPDLQAGDPGVLVGVKDGIKAASLVIAGITFQFLMTSNAAFTRSRKKEFGLWSLMGVTRGQLIAVVLWESFFIAAAALAIGLGFGLVFLRLFFMAISVLLGRSEALPVYAGLPVWLHTLSVFGGFFLFVSLYSMVDILRSTVIELIRAERKPKAEPTFRWWKALLGLVLVVGGYAWASVPWPTAIILGVVPVTVMVSLGTVFLMREGSVALLNWLRRREGFYYRTSPLLTISHLRFKLQENARVLANTAVAIAVILTAVSTIYTLLVVFAHEAQMRNPHAFQLVEPAQADSAAGVVEAELHRHGVADWARHELVTVWGYVQEETPVILAPYSLYAGVRRTPDAVRPLPDATGGALLIYPYTNLDPEAEERDPVPKQLTVGDRTYTVSVLPEWNGLPVNASGELRTVLVVSDAQLEQIVAEAAADRRLRVTMWDVAAWRTREASAAAQALSLQFPDDAAADRHFTSIIPAYQASVSGWGLTLFVGVFVSLVFFVTSCSVLYFRLFTEIDEDRRYFRRLQHLGVSQAEMRRVLLQQTQIIFFVPFLVGLMHCTFAMKALGTLAQRPVLHYGWLIALGYLGLYVLYYAVTYAVYWRTLSGGNARIA